MDRSLGWSALLRPFERFLATEARSAVVLFVAAAVALGMANSGFSKFYAGLWTSELGSLSVLEWINDFWMAGFFVLVGLEIKRELLVGELNTWRKAALPLVAAIGGMIAPALVYLAFAGKTAPSGWGVPMATDIAFALGGARLLGARVPSALLVFLTAFAIADDLGAVAVIAFFYGHAVHGIGWVALGVAALVGMNRVGVSKGGWYLLAGLPLWLAVHASGLHATLAGVAVGLSVPLSVKEASPLAELEHGLHPFVAYGVLPLFAFANAGVDLRGGISVFDPITLGIAGGLVIGKPVGILLASGVAVGLGIAELPANVRWSHLAGAAILGGIGFTMSLFVALLAFDPSQLLQAKVGILAGSGLAAVLGWAVLSWATGSKRS